jgi:hypothetical protein
MILNERALHGSENPRQRADRFSESRRAYEDDDVVRAGHPLRADDTF